MSPLSSDHEPLPLHARRRLLADAREVATTADADERRIGRYRILHELGRGGMGIVYAAEDPELGRRVALKVLALPPGASAAARQRFVFEAQASARLNHPHIAAIYEATSEAIAMQWIDGPPLSALRATPRERVVRWIADAAHAVQAAHDHGIVHRDLKPENLLVENDRVFVTDFGLAKALHVEAQISQSGNLLGTPAYMAPEQACGATSRIDARTDVWGLGATLFDLLAGRPPFLDRDVVTLLRRITEEDAPRLRTLSRDLPRELEVIVERCLQREMDQRYPTAHALAEDLERWLAGHPIQARAPSFSYRTRKLIARHQALVTLAVLALLAVLIATVFLWNERVARRASDAAMTLSARVASALDDAEMLRRLGASEAEAEERLQAGLAACAEFLERHDIPQAQYLRGRLLAASGHRAEAVECYERALAGDEALVEARYELCCERLRNLFAASAESSDWRPIEDGSTLASPWREERQRLVADLDLVVREADRLRRADAEYARAMSAWFAANRTLARRGLESAMRFDPAHREAALAQSRLELAAGQSDAAWAAAMQSVDLQRGLAPAYLARAMRSDPVDRALRQLELSAAEQRMDFGDVSAAALRDRGSARLRLADVEGALADLSRAVAEQPDDATAHAHLGTVHARRAAGRASDEHRSALDDWTLARDAFDAALLLNPSLIEAWNNRGVAELERARRLRALNRSDESEQTRQRARADFDAAIQRSPSSLLALLNRAREFEVRAESSAAQSRWPEAELLATAAAADLAAAESAHPQDFDAALAAAEVASLRAVIATRRFRVEAEQAHDRAVDLAPLDPLPRGLRGIFHARAGQTAAARLDLEAALSLRPSPQWRAVLERERNALP